ncbi:MAG: M3 family metallopeptidase [Gammaproteobacteria bacterium]
MNNPLLSEGLLPPFSRLKPEHIEPAVKQVISENQSQLRELLSKEDPTPDWGSVIFILDDLEDRLDNLWSTVSHLFSVNNSKELRDIYDRCLPLVTEYSTNLSQNDALYRRIKALRERAGELNLSDAQVKVLDDYLRDFKLAGITLDEDRKQRFKEIEKQLGQLSMRFSNNVLDATHGWTRHFTETGQLAGLPETALAVAEEAARQKGLEGYLLTLDFPCYHAVTTYADDHNLRREIYTAFVTRASDQGESGKEGDQGWDNAPLIDEILALRREKADLLGFESYAELSLATKMADNPEKVVGFLEELVVRGKSVAEREFKELSEFAATLGKDTLEAWDLPYYSEKLRTHLYDISQEELRAYFPAGQVKAGLFQIVGKLFGITIAPNAQYETWHDSVEAYDIFRDGELIARFFLDLYTRDSKRGGAWMHGCRTRRILDDGSLQLPAAYLVCNFSEGKGSKPSLLTHTEVTTLFHEFGHGLHHLLTREKSLRVSGINGVAWDAVELPSQLMENWCWNKESIKLISSHYQTGDPLPEQMLEKMLEAKNFQAGLKMMRQLEFGLFDFELHRGLANLGSGYVRDTMQAVRDKTSVIPTPQFNRFENSFSHIFAGGYAAGYYSYYWAEVLSADVFSKFEAAGVLDEKIGRSYLDKILSRGGAARALQLFKDFMGREPQIDALLAQKGIP